MGKENEIFNTIALKVVQHFDIPDINTKNENFKDEDRLKIYIASLVDKMIKSNFERFLNQMYILDVSEEKLNDVLSNSNTNELCIDIADLIIAREKEKNIWREKYKS